MYKLELWYSIQNCGDGSAYPEFMESKELAKWDQDNMDEGWGEPCYGSIILESESPIICKNSVTTIDEKIKEFESSRKEILELKKMKGN